MEDIVRKVKKVLEDNISSELKRPFFDGDPIFVSKSRMPTIAVMLESEDIATGPTGHDRRLYTLTIKVIVNKEDDFNKEPAQVVAHKTLRDFVEGIEDGSIRENSIVSVLRKNFTLDSEILNQILKVVYNTIDRKDVITEEAWLTFTIERLVEVSGRS
jgi:hypothetical protein